MQNRRLEKIILGVALSIVACAPDITQDNRELDGDGSSARPIARFDLIGQKKLPFPNFLVQELDGDTIGGKLAIPGEGALFEQVNELSGFTQLPIVTLDFSRDISTATIKPNENLLFMAGNIANPFVDFDFEFRSDEKKLYLYPRQPLDPNTNHAVILTKDIASPSGAPIQEDLFFHITKFTSPLYDDQTGVILSDLLVDAGISPTDAARLESLRLAYQNRLYGKAGDAASQIPLSKVRANLATSTGRSSDDVTDEEAIDFIAVAWAFKTSDVQPTAQLQAARDRIAASAAGVYSELSTAPAAAYYDFIESNYGFSFSHTTLAAQGGVVAEASISSLSFSGPDGVWPEALPAGKPLDVPLVIVYPGPLTEAPYPVVLFQHGLASCKRAAVLRLAEEFAASGIALAGIDAVEHGERSLTNADESNDADTAGLCGKKIDGRTIKSGEAFFNVDNIRATRDGLRQTVIDLAALRKALAATGNFSSIRFAGQSMGGVLGAMLLRVEPAIEAGVLNVPPAWLSRTVLTAPGFNAPDDEAGFQNVLAAELGESDVTSETFTDALAKVIPLVQGLLDEAEPAYYFDGLPAKKRVLIQMVDNDPVALNAGTELLAEVGGLTYYESAVTDSSGVSGVVVWPENPHGILLADDDPDQDGEDSVLTEHSKAMRRQMIEYLKSGGTSLLPVPSE